MKHHSRKNCAASDLVFAALAYRSWFFGSLVMGDSRLLIKDGQAEEEVGVRAAKRSDHDLEQTGFIRYGIHLGSSAPIWL